MYLMSLQILMHTIFAAHKEDVEETKSHRKRCFEDSNAGTSNKHFKIHYQQSSAHSGKNAEKQTTYRQQRNAREKEVGHAKQVNEESAVMTQKKCEIQRKNAE